MNPDGEHLGRSVAAFVDGEVDERARARLETHLSQCSSCRSEVRDATLVRETLSSVSSSELSGSTWGEVRARIVRDRQPVWTPAMALAATALLAAGIFMGSQLAGATTARDSETSTELWLTLGSSLQTETLSGLYTDTPYEDAR